MALVTRARAGDADAFRQIVERHESSVAATVIGMLGPGPEAEDVGQEVFIRLYRALDRFRGEATLRTYLVRIAMNLSLNALKRRKRSDGRFLRLERAPESPQLQFVSERPGADVEAMNEERRRAVLAAIDALDEAHRAVVVCRIIEELSTREAALALGVPEGTVMSRLSRALKKLAPELETWIVDHD